MNVTCESETGAAVEWKRFYELLSRPLCSRVLSDVEMHDVSSVVGEHEEYK